MQPVRGQRCPSLRGGGQEPAAFLRAAAAGRSEREAFSSCCNQGAARLPGTFALRKTPRPVPEGNFPGCRAVLASPLSARPAGKGLRMGWSVRIPDSTSCCHADLQGMLGLEGDLFNELLRGLFYSLQDVGWCAPQQARPSSPRKCKGASGHAGFPWGKTSG